MMNGCGFSRNAYLMSAKQDNGDTTFSIIGGVIHLWQDGMLQLYNGECGYV